MKMKQKKFIVMDHDLHLLFNGCVEPCTQILVCEEVQRNRGICFVTD
jgi:hypothetical protein